MTIPRTEFLKTLYAYCEGQLELRALPSKHQVFYDVCDYEMIDSFCKKHEGENVYFSVALRNGQDGTKESITQIACLHCDVDFKDIAESKAIEKIKAFQFQPTLIVRSGGGFHLYWRLKEAYDKISIPQIEKTNRVLAQALTGDMNACDASRILRLPDTFNVKKEYGTPRAVVCTKYLHVDYDVSDFEGLVADNSLYSSVKSIDNILDTSIGVSSQSSLSSSVVIDFNKGHRDSTLFHIANKLIRGGMSVDNIKKVMSFLGAHCSPSFSEKEVFNKIKSALTRENRSERSLAEEVREWILSSNGDFLSSDVVKELDLSSRVVKKNLSKILARLGKDGLIEKVGSRRGSWRLVENQCEDIDFKNVTAEPIFFNWPLPGLGNMIEIFPGNIIVIAGVQNAGKSAFMLDFTFKNMKKHKIKYFSSEMGAIEMRKRLMMFNVNLDVWDFEAKERSSNFPDVIDSENINIIDYLELHDSFYQIGGILKAIHDRLKNGVALIALQKNPGAPTGIGGYRGLEKPRLYINLESAYPGGVARIVKAKNWATSLNPNNYACKFKLISGCHFVEEGDWFLNN
jgi:hypothetical protein